VKGRGLSQPKRITNPARGVRGGNLFHKSGAGRKPSTEQIAKREELGVKLGEDKHAFSNMGGLEKAGLGCAEKKSRAYSSSE